MTDIFFSYSSKDRERVRPVRDALAAQGFDVFWDQEVPTGIDWDRWIRDHLNKSKCALVFWSVNSIASDNVRHEATVAKQHGKLVPVMLDALTAEQFPMGLYAVQAANLANWTGDDGHAGWSDLRHQVESKLTPLWVRRHIDTLDAELVAERARRDAAERRDRTLRDQIAKEAQAQQELRRELDHAHDEVAGLRARLEQVSKDAHGKRQQARDEALAEIASLQTQLEAARRQPMSPDPRVDELLQQIKTMEEERKHYVQANAEAAKKVSQLEQRISELETARDGALREAAQVNARAEQAEAHIAALSQRLATANEKALQGPNEALQSGAQPAARSSSSRAWDKLNADKPDMGKKPVGDALPEWLQTSSSSKDVDPSTRLESSRAARHAAGDRAHIRTAGKYAIVGVALTLVIALAHWPEFATGYGISIASFLAGLAMLLAFVILKRRRRGKLGDAERALYWLGCLPLAAVGLLALFRAFGWSWLGKYDVGYSGLLLGTLTLIGSFVLVSRRRTEPLSGLEVAAYWLGFSLVTMFSGLAIFDMADASWFGLSYETNGLLVGAIIAFTSALVTIRRRSSPLSGTEMAIYWLGCSLAALAAIPVILRSSVSVSWAAGSLATLLIILLIGAYLRRVARRRASA